MGDVQLGAQLCAAALSGTALPSILGFVWRRIKRDPKAEAEARKLNVEADGMVLDRLYGEIDRLDRELEAVRKEQAAERKECAAQIAEMQGQIKQLLQQQNSFGNMGEAPLRTQLRTAFRPDPSDKDDDLIGKLDRVPTCKRRRK